MSSNICAGGSYFKTDAPLSVGTDVKVELILTFDKLKKFGVKRSHVVAFGSILRTNNQGMAVCFGKKFHISPLI